MKHFRHVFLFVIIGFPAINAIAQISPGQPFSSAIQYFGQTWDITEDDSTQAISQSVIPLGVFIPIRDGVEVRLSSSWVKLNKEKESGEKESVSGFTDLKMQVNYAFLERSLLVGLVVNLPSGTSALSQSEQDVLFAFVAPDLSVRENRFGEGFNLGTTLSYAKQSSPETAVGAGFSLIYRGPYETTLNSSSVTISPGFEANFNVALDKQFGLSKLRLSSGFTFYGSESLIEDEPFFQLGPRFLAQASYSRPMFDERGFLSLSVQEIYRLSNSTQIDGVLTKETQNSNSNYFILLGSTGYSFNDKFRASTSFTGRFLGQNELGDGDNKVFEFGLSTNYRMTDLLGLSLGGRFIKGSGNVRNGENSPTLAREITGSELILRMVFHL